MIPDELKKMFQFRWQVAGGKADDFPFEEQDTESFKIMFRYSKGSPRDAIKIGDELLKVLVGKDARKANPTEVEEVAQKTLRKSRSHAAVEAQKYVRRLYEISTKTG